MNKSFDIVRNRHNNISNNMGNRIQNKNLYINIKENFPQNDKTFQTQEQTLKELENKIYEYKMNINYNSNQINPNNSFNNFQFFQKI